MKCMKTFTTKVKGYLIRMIKEYVGLHRQQGKTTRLLDAVADAVAIGQRPIIFCPNDSQVTYLRSRIKDLGLTNVLVTCTLTQLRGSKPPLFIDNYDMLTYQVLRAFEDIWLEDVEMATYTIPEDLPDEW